MKKLFVLLVFLISVVSLSACADDADTVLGFAESSVTLDVDGTQTITLNNPANIPLAEVSFVSENEAVVTVDASGTVEGMNVGMSSIHLMYEGAIIDYLDVYVTDASNDPVQANDVRMRVTDGMIEWSLAAEGSWRRLVTLTSAVKSTRVDDDDVEFNTTSTHIQWRYEGETEWNTLAPLTVLAQTKLTSGTDGREVEFDVDGQMLVWRYEGDTAWQTLYDLSTLQGQDGNNGLDGTDGRKVEFNATETDIEWRYEGEDTWTELLSFDVLSTFFSDLLVDFISFEQLMMFAEYFEYMSEENVQFVVLDVYQDMVSMLDNLAFYLGIYAYDLPLGDFDRFSYETALAWQYITEQYVIFGTEEAYEMIPYERFQMYFAEYFEVEDFEELKNTYFDGLTPSMKLLELINEDTIQLSMSNIYIYDNNPYASLVDYDYSTPGAYGDYMNVTVYEFPVSLLMPIMDYLGTISQSVLWQYHYRNPAIKPSINRLDTFLATFFLGNADYTVNIDFDPLDIGANFGNNLVFGQSSNEPDGIFFDYAFYYDDGSTYIDFGREYPVGQLFYNTLDPERKTHSGLITYGSTFYLPSGTILHNYDADGDESLDYYRYLNTDGNYEYYKLVGYATPNNANRYNTPNWRDSYLVSYEDDSTDHYIFYTDASVDNFRYENKSIAIQTVWHQYYEVTFNDNTDTEMSKTFIEDGGTIVLPDTSSVDVPDGYEVVWKDSNDQVVTNETIVSGAMTVTMTFEPIQYNITTNIVGGGNGLITADPTAGTGESVTVTGARMTENDLFAGFHVYYTDNNGDQVTVARVTGYTVTFDMPAFDVTVDATIESSLNNPVLIDLNAVLSNIETNPTGYSGTFELTENELTASYDPADITANPDLPYNELDLLLASLSVAEGGGITTIIFEGLEYTYVPASAAPQNVAGFYRFEDTDTAPGLNNWGRGGTRLVTTVKSWFDRREDDSQKASITMKNANDAQFTINYDVEEIQLAPSYYFLTDDGQFIQLDNVSNELLNKINDDVADLLLRSGDVSFQDYLETYLTQFRIDVNYYSKLELAGRSDLVERKQVTRLNDLKTYIEGWTDDKVSVTEELPIVVFNFIGFLYSYIDITDMSTNTQIQYLLNPVLFDPTSPYYVYDHFVTTNYPQFNISDDLFMTHENAFVYHDVLFDTGPEGDWYFYRNISEGAFVARQTMIDGFVNDGIDMSFIFHERHTIELYPILSSSGLNTNRQIPLSENLTFFLNYEIIEEDEDWNETIIEEYTYLRQPVDISTLTTEQEIFEYLVNLGTGLDITLDEYGEYNGTSFSIEFNFTLVSDGQTYEVNPMNFAYYETNTEPYWLTRINAFTYQNMLGGHILDTLMDEYDLDLNQALFILNDPNLQVTYNMSIFYQKYVDAA